MKNYLVVFFVYLFTVSSQGQIPSGYYDAAKRKTGTALQAALHNIIKDHTVVSYDYIWTSIQTTDKKPNGRSGICIQTYLLGLRRMNSLLDQTSVEVTAEKETVITGNIHGPRVGSVMVLP